MDGRNWKYKIGVTALDFVIPAAGLIVFCVLGLLLRKHIGGAILFFYIYMAIFAFIMLFVIYKGLFVKMYIDDEGFFCQTDIGGGKYYKASDISEASTYSWGSRANYFIFKTVDGKAIKFNYKLTQSDGIDFLMSLINGDDPYAPYQYVRIIRYENGFLCFDKNNSEDYFKFSELEKAWQTDADGHAPALFNFTVKDGDKEFNVVINPEQQKEIEAIISKING